MKKKIAAFLAFMLVIVAALPTAASTPRITELLSASVEFQNESKEPIKLAVSSTNELLVAGINEYYDEEADEYVDMLQFFKVKNGEYESILSLPNSEVVFFQHDNYQVYAFVINYDENTLDIYDENFELVQYYTLDNIQDAYFDEAFQYKKHASIVFRSGESIIFNLSTLKAVTHMIAPAKEAVATGDVLHIKDVFGQMKETISFANLLQKEKFDNAYIDNSSIQLKLEYLTFLYVQETEDEMNWYLVTSDYDGNILYKQHIPTNPSFYDFPTTIISSNSYTIFSKDTMGSGYVKSRTYNPATGKLSASRNVTKPFDYIFHQVNDYYLANISFEEIGVYDVANNAYQYSLTNPSTIALGDATNEFGIVSGDATNEQYTRFDYELFDVKTGETLQAFNTYAANIVQDEYVVTQVLNGTTNTNFTLYKLEIINPRPLQYADDKTWTITFNAPVQESTVTNDTIYVINTQNEKQNVQLETIGTQVRVLAPTNGYTSGQYTLHIDAISSTSDLPLQQAVTKPFTIQ